MPMNLPAVSNSYDILESVLIKGDLSKLTPEERSTYYTRVCQSVGLNPLTKPFEYITLNGKLRLYALKDATDQLRSIHKVSVVDMTETEREGLSIVKTKVQNAEGRTDMAIGAVNIAGLKGEALANALMKAETKSKRRATLSICGLGMLDETEIEDIPETAKRPAPQPAQHRVPSPSEVEQPNQSENDPVTLVPFKNESFQSWSDRYIVSIKKAKNEAELDQWDRANDALLNKLSHQAPAFYSNIDMAVKAKRASLQPKEDPISTGPIKVKSDAPDFKNQYEDWFKYMVDKISKSEDGGALESFWNAEIEPHKGKMFPTDYTDLMEMHDKQQAKLKAED